MTGPEHYAEAERLIDSASQAMIDATPNTINAARLVANSAFAAAQVHATLALAAATAAPVVRGAGYVAHDRAWREVAGYPGERHVDMGPD